MVFRMRNLGCSTKGKVVKANRFLSRARAYRRNTLILSFPDENRSDINVLNNTMGSMGMERGDKNSGFSPAQGFWLDSSESKKTTEETSNGLSSKSESLLNSNPIKP